MNILSFENEYGGNFGNKGLFFLNKNKSIRYFLEAILPQTGEANKESRR
jgi:hypothetical protein